MPLLFKKSRTFLAPSSIRWYSSSRRFTTGTTIIVSFCCSISKIPGDDAKIAFAIVAFSIETHAETAQGVDHQLLPTTSFTNGIRIEKLTGFTRERRTPASAAAAAVATEEYAVMSATTTFGWQVFKRRQSSRPSMPGIM